MVLFYAAARSESAERLWQVITRVVQKQGVKRVRTLRGLSQALRRPGKRAEIVVLVAADREELQRIVAIRELLWDLRVILVLPDGDPKSAANGHLLRPRFMTHGECRFHEVAAVLGRMLERLGPGRMESNIITG